MQLKDVVAKLFELWNLMDSSKEERNSFRVITSVVGTSESEITDRGVLSTEMIEKVSKFLSVSSPFVYLFFHSFNLFCGDAAPKLKSLFAGFSGSGQAYETKS